MQYFLLKGTCNMFIKEIGNKLNCKKDKNPHSQSYTTIQKQDIAGGQLKMIKYSIT